MRIVLDTNVLLSGFVAKGLCEALLDICLNSPEHTTVLSEYILQEFRRCLESRFIVPADTAELAVQTVIRQVQLVKPADVPCDACGDPPDLPILGTLVAGRADCFVDGDKDLLSLGTYQGHPILSPRQAYTLLTKSSTSPGS